MVKAVCDSCGKECELPFKPTAGKPVYCSDCFKSKGGDSRSSDNRGSKNSDLSRIEEKLDRILKILEKSD
ncbi:hypothetical protein H6503_03985 [Candidatus Woesearchaeota archaeon]|nr:hypothetical protein [Candidatus Woesearchaeota archaeon]